MKAFFLESYCLFSLSDSSLYFSLLRQSLTCFSIVMNLCFKSLLISLNSRNYSLKLSLPLTNYWTSFLYSQSLFLRTLFSSSSLVYSQLSRLNLSSSPSILVSSILSIWLSSFSSCIFSSSTSLSLSFIKNKSSSACFFSLVAISSQCFNCKSLISVSDYCLIIPTLSYSLAFSYS